MAHVSLVFHSADPKDGNKLTAYVNADNLVYIKVGDLSDIMYSGHIVLDRPTAIRLVKELKRIIGEIGTNE